MSVPGSHENPRAVSVSTQRYVRRQILAAVPRGLQGAVTPMAIVASCGLHPEKARAHMVRLRMAGSIARTGSGTPADPYRYYRPTDAERAELEENDQEEEEMQGVDATEAIRSAVPVGKPQARTVKVIARLAGCDDKTAATTLRGLENGGEIAHIGRGVRGDPFLYYTPNGAAPAPDPDVLTRDVSSEAPEKAPAQPPAVEVEATINYGAIVEDLQGRERHLEEQLALVRNAIDAVTKVEQMGVIQ